MPTRRFLLAQLYLGERNEEKYQSEMLKLLDLKARNPQHLAHFVNYWIGRNQLDQADRWLAELKKAEPQGLAALELEARLLDLRKRKPELLALLEARGREVPDQIGPVADLFNRYGFAKEAEAGLQGVHRPRTQATRAGPRPGPVPGPPGSGRRGDGDLVKAWTTCRPEQVAAAALSLYDAPSAERAAETTGGSLGGRGRPEAARSALLTARLGDNLDSPRSV